MQETEKRTRRTTPLAWAFIAAGLPMTLAPLVSGLIPLNVSESKPLEQEVADFATETTSVVSMTFIHVPSVIPAIGGLLLLCGAIFHARISHHARVSG